MADHGRLVRDGVPVKLRKRGIEFTHHSAGLAEYAGILNVALGDAAAGFGHNPSLDELADAADIIELIKALYGWSDEQLAEARADKQKRLGRYERRIVIDEVSSQEN